GPEVESLRRWQRTVERARRLRTRSGLGSKTALRRAGRFDLQSKEGVRRDRRVRSALSRILRKAGPKGRDPLPFDTGTNLARHRRGLAQESRLYRRRHVAEAI